MAAQTMATETMDLQQEKTFRAAQRINRSLTAAAEKRALEWMARRAPQWVSSDGLTALGLAAQIAAGVCYAMARWNHVALFGVVLCLGLNWLGDSLDGTLARVRRCQRPRYGFYVDHVVDMLGATALMAGMGASRLVHWQVAMAMLVAFLLLSGESYLATYTLGCFQLSQGIFGPTEVRILLAIGTVELMRNPYAEIFGRRVLLFDVGGVIAAVCMAVMLMVCAARHTAQLYREEPLP